MTRVLVVAETVDGVLDPSSAEAVTAAAGLGGEVVVAVVAPDAATIAGQAAYSGVPDVVAVSGVDSDRDHEQLRHAVGALVADVAPDVVLAPFSIRSSGWAPALSWDLDLAFVPDVVALEPSGNGVTATRSVYGGRVTATYELDGQRPALVLVRPGSFPPAQAGDAPRVRTLDVDLRPSRVRSVEVGRPAGDLDLAGADVILAVGRGVGSRENIETYAELAGKLGAALGATRPVVDAGWLPAGHQVGQTGTTVRPKLYLAFGISGALQHLSGMKDSATIVAINSDAQAPIFRHADVGAVADMHEVAEELRTLVEANPDAARSGR